MSPDDPMAGMDTMDAAEAPPNPLVTIPLTDEQITTWRGEIDRANTKRKIFEPSWERNLKAYAPDPSNEQWGADVNVGVDFYQTEQKKDQLFFDTPEVVLTPEPDTDPKLAAQISQRQTQLNRRLGRKGLDFKRLMDKLLVDIICPAGFGCVKIGVTRITRDVADPSDPTGTATVPVPVYQKIFAERFSPKQVLIPTSFHDTEFDKAPWLGMKFTMPRRPAIREFGLGPDFAAAKTTSADDQVFQYPGVSAETEADQVTGVVVYYKAALQDDAVYHPDWYRELVFLDGQRDPVVHRDCPYQTFENGAFTPDSLLINPIQIGTVRDLPDSSYPPSDCTVTRPLVNELNRFRTQLVEQRDSSTSVRIADETVVTNEILTKIVRSPWGAILPVANYDPTRAPIMELAKTAYPRENFTAQEIIERDLTKINTLSANQVGTEAQGDHSATELTYVQRNADVRMQAERNRITAFFLTLVEGIDTLMRRYETPPGQQPVAGYSYDIKPDSGMHIDAASDRKFALDRYNQLRKDPDISAPYLLRELAPKLHLDPSQLIVQPPPPKPEPPKVSFIVKGEDLNPLSPQYSSMLEALAQAGMTLAATPITPELIKNAALAQPIPAPHGGTADHADVVSKHSADETHSIPHFGGLAGAH